MTITQEEVSAFISTHKKRAGLVLNSLAKKKEFHDAITSELGSQIMGSAITRMEYLIEKLISGDFTDEERVEMKVLRRISGEWADMVSAYLVELNKVRQNKI